jgi:hypothetical protein
MKIAVLVALFASLLVSDAFAQRPQTYAIAHTRTQNVDMIAVKVGARYFEADAKTQARLYTDFQACARRANLGGTVILVSSVKGRLRYYGPKTWHTFLSSLNVDWIDARVNKNLTCKF